MAAASVSGIVSGMDSKGIINALKGVKEIQINQLKSQKSNINSQISKVGTIKSAMNELAEFLEDFQTDDEVLEFSGTSTDEDVLTVSTGGNAKPGSYNIGVAQLATLEKNRSQAFPTAVGEVREGTITLTVKDEDPVEVEITEGMTLTQVADAINASSAEVFASLLHDGVQSYLQISAKETGHVIGGDPNDAIVISENYTGSEGAELNLTQITTASNAMLNIDGLDVQQTTNNVSEVLEGVTLELKEPGTVFVKVAPDKEKTKENLQAFVDKYNAAFEPIAKELKVTEDTNYSRSLAGDASIKRLKLALQTAISKQVTGTTGTWNALSDIGIETDPTGKLTIDSDDLDAALDKDIAGIASLFTVDTEGLSDRLISVMDPYTEDLEGIFKAKVDSFNDRIELLDDEIADQRFRIDKMVLRLTKQFANMEMAIQGFNQQGGALAGLASLD